MINDPHNSRKMKNEALIDSGFKLSYHCRVNEDGTNDGSLIAEVRTGMVYCIAKAPRYATKEEWEYNCKTIIEAIEKLQGDRKKSYLNQLDKSEQV